MGHTPPPRPTRPAVSIQPASAPEAPPYQAPEDEPVAVKGGTLASMGFVPPALIIKSPDRPFHRLMLSLEGMQGTGKSEFANSAPGPGAHIVLDRAIDSILDNPNPPPTRSPNFLYKVCKVPKPQSGTQATYLAYWKEFKSTLYAAIGADDCRTVVIDGDPDSWEMQRLAEWGRVSKVPPLLYDGVNAARRALYARCYDSGKIIIATSRVKQVWKDKFDPITGLPVMKDDGSGPAREAVDEFYKEGFKDAGHVWTIRLLCMHNKEKQQFGVRVVECKVNKPMEGLEFWGDECNFATVVSYVYPQYTLAEWGY